MYAIIGIWIFEPRYALRKLEKLNGAFKHWLEWHATTLLTPSTNVEDLTLLMASDWRNRISSR